MGRIASAIVVLAGAHLLAVGMLGYAITGAPGGSPLSGLALFGGCLMVAGFIAMLPGGWRNKRVEYREQTH